MSPDQELDAVVVEVQRLIQKYRAEYDGRPANWLPPNDGGTEWFHQLTSRRRNMNRDVDGEPIWAFETFAGRLQDEASRIFSDYSFEAAADDPEGQRFWANLRNEILESLLDESVAGAS